MNIRKINIIKKIIEKKSKRNSNKKTYPIYNVVVKGYNKEDILKNERIVNKVVNKIIGKRKKHTLKATNLTLKSQHGYGIEE